jgi:hypothetical protein
LKNRARPDIGRDDDAVKQVTLVTGAGAAQVWFRGTEESKDEKLTKEVANLVSRLTQIRKKNAAGGAVEPPKERTQNRWCVVVEASTVNPSSNDSPPKYSVKVYDVTMGEKQLLLETEPQGNDAALVKSFVAAVKEGCKLPTSEKVKNSMPAASSASIKIVLRQATNNRRQDFWFNRDDADRLGAGKQAKGLIAILNQKLEPKGIQLPVK